MPDNERTNKVMVKAACTAFGEFCSSALQGAQGELRPLDDPRTDHLASEGSYVMALAMGMMLGLEYKDYSVAFLREIPFVPMLHPMVRDTVEHFPLDTTP